jgi:thioredoxin-like negative regulator of GroEL
MRLIPLTTSFLAAALLSACGKPAPAESKVPAATAAAAASAASSAHPAEGIAWRHALNDADVDASFTLARSQNKPVFVYWGAAWCPPCNQLKATLFNRQDFIARSKAFVAVYIDGDSPGAQKLGARFKVRGYPTTVLFNAEGVELTRLPGEVDAAQYTQIMTLGMNAQRPVKAVLEAAQNTATAAQLSPNDWKLLAFYSWETDEQQAAPTGQLPTLLKQLAQACPASESDTATRLMLKSVAAVSASEKSASPQVQHRDRVLKLLADAAASRSQMDVLTNSAAELVRGLSASKTSERAALVGAFNAALKTLEADNTLSRADRLTALNARVELAKIDDTRSVSSKDLKPFVPEALQAEVRAHVAQLDRDITDGYERQAVITSAADVLEQAGLLTESSALLESNLSKSHSPYYLMSGLASNAKKRGDIEGALRVAVRQASANVGHLRSQTLDHHSYVRTLIELAPQDEARIERTVQQLFAEAAAQPNAFFERSARSLQRVGTQLQTWNKDKKHAVVVQRLRTQMTDICARLPDGDTQRAACDAVFKPPAAVAGKAA